MCKCIIFFKNFFHCNVSQFIVAITATKYCFVCIYKSIPTINDNFLATFLYLTINMNSFIITTVMMELPGRYPLNFVSVNINGYLNNMNDGLYIVFQENPDSHSTMKSGFSWDTLYWHEILPMQLQI